MTSFFNFPSVALTRLEALRQSLQSVTGKVDKLAKSLDLLTEYHIQLDERMRYMQRAWDDLVAQVADLKTFPASVDAGFKALEVKLQTALDSLSGAPTVDEVNAVKADVAKAVADIKAAIPANVS